MKPPKKTKKAIETIETMIEWLHFYMGDRQEFREFVRNDVKNLQEYLTGISTNDKLKSIKLAKRLKALWKQEMAEKEEKIAELEGRLGKDG